MGISVGYVKNFARERWLQSGTRIVERAKEVRRPAAASSGSRPRLENRKAKDLYDAPIFL